MTKLTAKTIDGWPLMEPLGPKESDLLQRNLAPDERILGLVIGQNRQVVAATDHKVLVVKTGLMAGETFGGKATPFDYRAIVGVEVHTGWSQGEFEIVAASASAPQRGRNRDRVNVSESANGIVFVKANSHLFQNMAAKIREMIGAAHSAVIPEAASPVDQSIPEQIRALSDLHVAGILTDGEFTEKKAELLARM